MTYSLTGTVPSGASVNPTTGLFTWTPGTTQPTGPTLFTLMVADNESSSVSESFSVNVEPAVNVLPPALQSIPTQSATVGKELQVALSQYASDPNSPALPLTYSLGAIAPPGASIGASGLLTWTPAANQPVGPTPITVLVSDNQSPPDVVSETFTVNVSPLRIEPDDPLDQPGEHRLRYGARRDQLDATAPTWAGPR